MSSITTKKGFLLSFMLFTLFSIQQAFSQNCSVNAGVAETICENATYNLSGSASGLLASTPTWSQVGGPSVSIANPTDLNTGVSGLIGGNSYTFRLSADCTDGASVFQDVVITVEPITIADAGSNLESCPDSSGAIVTSANAPLNAGETGVWSIDGNNNAGVIINSPTSPTTTLTLPETSAGTTTLRWTITGPNFAPGQSCESFDTITVINSGGVEPVSAGSDQTLDNCYTVSQNTNLNGSFGGNNVNGQQGTWSFVSGPSTPTIANPNNNQTNVSELIEGTYTFRWTVAGPCANGVDTMTITVPAATQDVTNNSTASTIRICDPTVDTVTLVGSSPEFTNETVEWTQISGPTAGVTIVSPNEVSTRVTGLASPSTYVFRLTTLNSVTGCDDIDQVTINYSPDPISITANGGDDIVAPCGFLNVDIPFTTTGEGSNTFSIVDGPSGSTLVNPGSFSATGSSPLDLSFDEEGTYTILFRRSVGGEQRLGCTQATDEIQVTVALVPTAANAGTDQTLACDVTSTALAGNTPSVGSGIWSQVEGPSTATIDDPFATNINVSNMLPGTYRFRYTISGGAPCSPPAEDDVLVFVSSSSGIPTDAGPDQTVCFAGPVVLDADPVPNSTLLGTWTVDSAPGGAIITFSDENDPNTTVFGLDDPNETYVLRWSIANPSDPICPSTGTDTVTISTNAVQGPSIANAGPDQCLPTGTVATTLSGSGPLASEEGLWTAVPNTGITFADATQFNTSVSISIEQSYTLTWTISTLDPSCQDATDDVEITVGAPATADAGPDQELCSATATMAASASVGATGLWSQLTGPGGVTINDDTSPSAQFTFTFSGEYTFEWTASNGSCSSASDQITIVVGIPPTTSAAGSDQVICNDSQATLGANAFNAAVESGFWTVQPGAPSTPTFSDVNDPNATITDLVTGTYTLQWNIASGFPCPASTDIVQIQVFSAANAGPDLTFCETNNFTLEATFGSQGIWTQVDGPGVSGNPGTPADIVQQPANSFIANVTIFSSDSYTFEFTTDYGGTCPVTSDQVVVSTSLPPSVDPDAGPDQILCIDDLAVAGTTTLAGSAPPGDVTNAEWRFADQPTGSVAVIDTPNDPNTTVSGLTVPGVYILEWNFEVNSCSNRADVLRLEVFEPPSTADAGVSQTAACQLDAQLDAVPPAVGIGTWSFENPGDDPSGGAVVIDSPNSPTTTLSNITTLGTYTLTWTVSNGNTIFPDSPSSACDPSVDTVSITFTDDVPSDADAGPDQELCDVTQTNLDAVPVASGTGTWSQTNGPGVNGNPGTAANITAANDPQALILDLGAGTYEFTWTTSNGGCDFTDTMQVVILEQPANANAGPDQNIIQFTPVVLDASIPNAGEGQWTQVSGPTTAIFDDDTNPNTEVFGTDVGIYEFQWTVTNGICASSSDTMILEIIGIVDLSLNKTVSPAVANVGETVTFTLEVSNAGPADATGVTVQDIVPSGYTIATINDGGVQFGNVITWSGLSVTNSGTTSVSFEATVNMPTGANGEYTNTAQVTASDQSDMDSTPDNDDGDQSEDDEDSATVTLEQVDLELDITNNTATGNVGDTVDYTVSVFNNDAVETGDATGVDIVVVIPPGMDIVTGSISNGGVFNLGSGTITWSGLDITNGATLDLDYQVTINDNGNYDTVGEITASDLPDVDSTPNNDDGDQSEDDEDLLTFTLQSADLSLDKTVSPTTASVGDTVTFTLEVSNAGPDDATGVAIEDVVPIGYTVGTINDGGVQSGSTITWSGLSVTNGASTSVSFTATLNAPTGASGEYQNTAQITESDQGDPDSGTDNDDGDQSEDDEDSATITLEQVDLELDITNSTATGNVGDTVDYTVSVFNNDAVETGDATGVDIVVAIPPGMDIVTGSISNGGIFNPGSGTITWSELDIANGATLDLDYQVTINDNGNYDTAGEITASDLPDVDSTPNNDDGDQSEDDEDIATFTIQSADLSLAKSVTPTSASVGQTVTFTLEVSNAGPDNATGVSIADLVPDGYTIGTINDGGTRIGNEITWTGLTVANGGSTSVSFEATVNMPTGTTGEYDNTAQITASDQVDPDSTPDNDDGDQSEDDESVAGITLEQVDLQLDISNAPTSGNAGDTVTYTVDLFNDDTVQTGDATGVDAVVTVPSGFTIVTGSISNGGVYNPGSGTITWSGVSVANGDTQSFTYDVTVNPSGNYDTTGEITASDLPDVDSTPNNDDGDQSEDDEDIATFTIQSADLSLAKSVTPTSASVGQTVTFTLEVSNAGPDNATGVTVQDIVPDGYTIGTINDGGTRIGNEITWTGLTVTNGGSTSVSFEATVNMPTGTTGEYTNTAQVTASDQVDPDSTPDNDDGDQSEDDESVAGITLEQVDLQLDISNAPTSGNAGDTVTYTVDLINDDTVQTGDATGVDVVVTVPLGFTIVTGSISNGGVYNPGSGTITWSGVSVANGDTESFTYDVTVNPSGNYDTVGEITASDLPDVDSTPNNDDGDQSEDDEDIATFTIQSADLSLVKDISGASSATPNVGDTVTFELTLTNAGPDTATNIEIEDELPRGYTLTAINNGGTAIGGTFLSWNIASLPVGSTTVSYSVTVNAPSGDIDEYLNIAEVTASDQFDPDSEPLNDDGDQDEDDEDFFEVVPQTVDLELTKTVSSSTPNVGEVVTFTITINNLGTTAATNVAIEDTLPLGFANIANISNSGSFGAGVVSWSGLNVPVGTTNLTFDAEVQAPTGAADQYLNVVQLTASDQFDPDSTPNNDNGDQSEDDEANVSVSPQVADLSISKTANTAAPNVGDTVIFTLTVNNLGPNSATGVALQDILPVGYTLTTVNNGGSQAGNIATWTGLSVLANGGSISVTYEAVVNPPTGAVDEYLNQASITASDQFDPDSDPTTDNTVDEDGNGQPDDDDEDALNLPPSIADLSLTKIVVDGDTSPQVGTEISFEITVFNDGPSDADGVVVTDLLPSGFDFVLYSATAGIYTESTGIWLVGDISSGGTETLVIDVLVNATGNYTNVAEVTASDVFDSDSTPNNDILAEDDQDEVTVTPINTIDIALDKSVSDETPDVNTNITFTIMVTNEGPSEATNLQVLDLLPSGYTYVSDDASGAYNDATGNWNIGNLASGSSATLNILANVNTTGDYVNVAEVISHTELDIDSTPNNDILDEDDQDEVIVVPRPLVDISVTKVADTMTPNIGGEITFTVTVTNDGPSDATNIVVTDLLESGYEFVSASTTNGVYEALNGSWTIGDLDNGTTETIVITATVLANGTYTNTAELTDLNEFDIDSEPSNNDDTEDDQETIEPSPILVSDLELTKTVSAITPLVGEEVIFTLSLTNNGPSTASGVTVVDLLPSGYTYISNNSTAGVYNEDTGLWSLNGTIPVGTTETLNIVVRVNPTGDYTNAAEITASDTIDVDSVPANSDPSEDDQDSATTNPIPLADLSLLKTVDNEFPDVSDTVTFTLTLSNAGPSDATGIQVSDALPSGYSYISDDGSGAYDPNTGIWDIASLGADATAVLNITVGINTTGNYTNSAELVAVNELDPNSVPGNNDSNEDDQDEQATLPRVITDISVVKTVDNLNPSVGSQIMFTITVTNDGPSDATGLVVEDILASGYDFVSATPSAGTYDEVIGSWDIATLPNGTSETLDIVATVLTNGDYSNTAELIALDTFDPDSSPDNNLNSEDDQDTVNPTPTGLADLSITKTVDELNPNVGDIIEFTINLTNSGDSNATGVIVSEVLPSGFLYQAHTSTAGVYDEITGIWNTNGVIPNGTTETLIILAQVNAPSGTPGEFTNQVQITASDQSDPDSNPTDDFDSDDLGDGLADDDEAIVVVVPQQVDIAVQKVVDNARPNIGDEISFTITITNNGMLMATNIGIEEQLPNGYRFISANTTDGSYDASEGFWELDNLGPNATATLTLLVEVLDFEDYENIANLAFVDQFDSNDTNDSDSATIEPTCLVFYNEFSPNGDGVNETFVIDCISRYPNNTLQIYNRWGNIVFEAQGYNNEFDGTSNGRAVVQQEEFLPVGTYYYILNLGDGSAPIADWLYINR
ncbi:hypothetical protein MTsPCn5_37440 [Croceitalea sp. MTPC5]|uniref:PKD domain-containing protein n=1 Tax=Croceitalea sp. MTPC5 TaxID=3056565 RepID=UPI002B3A8F6B|nr:hypothetical protein MTsPCn5_37440 [Croceitalea sp. MTPC5]